MFALGVRARIGPARLYLGTNMLVVVTQNVPVVGRTQLNALTGGASCTGGIKAYRARTNKARKNKNTN